MLRQKGFPGMNLDRFILSRVGLLYFLFIYFFSVSGRCGRRNGALEAVKQSKICAKKFAENSFLLKEF